LARTLESSDDSIVSAINVALGTILGGGLGATIAHIVTESSGISSGIEVGTLDKITEYISQNGNALFASEEAFKEVLYTDLKIDDDKLVNSLTKNMKAVEDLTKIERQRLVTERAEWDAAYSAY
jgi:hypothetical protein